MGLTIGDVWLLLHGDDSALVADGQKAGRKAGDAAAGSFNERFSSMLKDNARKAIGATIGAGVGLALSATTKLDTVTRQLQSDTGMTADEAKRAQHAIAGMFGSNLQGFDAVGAAMANVHNDLGLTGAAADRATERFLKFGTAVDPKNPDSAPAHVKAFDDILDAWQLTADAAPGIMDKLIVSHQRFGGVITESEAALSALAPAMTAANMTIDDGIGLLNLFNAAGIDAAKAPQALAHAIAQLKPGETINDLIAQISAIEDPTKRAQKAMEIFGARAGTQMAAALRPGMGALSDFAVSTEDAAGATDRAAGIIENSFDNRLKRAFKQAGAWLAEFGTNFGDLALIASAFGPKFTTAIVSGLGAVAGALSPKVAAMFTAVLGSAVVTSAISAAGDKAATLYLQALIAGDALPTALAGAWAAIPGSAAVGTAISAVGAAIAGSLVAAIGAGLAIFGIGLVIADWIKSQSGMTEEQWKDQVYGNYYRMGGGSGVPPEVKASTEVQTAALHDLWATEMDSVGMAAGASLGTSLATSIGTSTKEAYAASYAAGKATMAAVAAAIIAGKTEVVNAWKTALTERNRAADAADQIIINNAEITAQKKILADKHATAAEQAQARIRLRDLRASNLELLAEQSQTGTRTEQIAKTKALLASKALLKGLKDKDPDVRQHWIDLKTSAEAQLKRLQADGTTYGRNFTSNFAEGLVKDIDRVGANARAIARVVKKYLAVSSPSEAGPFSLMGGPEGWGLRWISLYNRGVAGGLPQLNGLLANLGGMSTPGATATGSMPAGAFAAASPVAFSAGPVQSSGTAQGAAAAAGNTYNFNVPITGLVKAKDPFEIATQLRRFATFGTSEPMTVPG